LTLLAGTIFNSTGQEAPVAPGRLLVKARPGHSVADAVRPYSGKEDGGIDELGISFVKVPEHALVHALQGLQHNPNIEFAEEDAIIAPEAIANDPYFASAWHLPKISATTAWDASTGTGVIIAILDTGVDGTHPDLAPKMIPGWNVYSGNSDTSDVHGHGTGVAGTAAAASNNSLGVTGVALNTKIMPIRISDPTGYATWSATAQAITWAANNGARVANISFSGMQGSSTINSAAQYMQSKGGVVVTAAGNSSTFDSTADNPYLINVSATDQNDLLTSFSNTGNNIDLSAPGISIWSTTRGGGYGAWSGTSLAAPVVSGTAALVIAAQPTLTAAQILDVLKKSADDLGATGWDSSFGKGRVNAANAVALARNTIGSTTTTTPPPAPATDTIAPQITITSPASGARISKSVSVSVKATDNVAVTRVELYVDGRAIASSTSLPFTTKWNAAKAAGGTHSIQTKAYDAAGNSALSQIVTVTK
jgi:thermitase